MPWSARFDQSIRLRDGRELSTLQHAADYIMKLPETVQREERWQLAVENLIDAAETGGDWLMFARIAVMRALNAENSRPLFQRGIYRAEFGVERAADAVDGGDNDDTEAHRDQAILNGRRAGFVAQES